MCCYCLVTQSCSGFPGALSSSPDRKNCENVQGKPEDLAYNAASFIWCPEMGAKVSEGTCRLCCTLIMLYDCHSCMYVMPCDCHSCMYVMPCDCHPYMYVMLCDYRPCMYIMPYDCHLLVILCNRRLRTWCHMTEQIFATVTPDATSKVLSSLSPHLPSSPS